MEEKVKKHILRLAASGRDIFVSSIDDDGFPNTKAMFRCKSEGVGVYFFSTNTSSARVQQFLKRPQACLYFVDRLRFHGLMLIGGMEVLTDQANKDMLWRPGDEKYYPLGPTDPDYCVLRFTARRGNYYHGSMTEFTKIWFEIGELIQGEGMPAASGIVKEMMRFMG